ncbi:MAG: DUF3082 domain-containing protein [Cyanobacteria bacterium]|nr:DUF3082 domain-containing protein [Cyanobacteriota bacterium]
MANDTKTAEIPVDRNLGELSFQRIAQAFLGSGVASTMAIVMYRILNSIALTFATKPVTSDNTTVINLSAAVRTLVMGVFALGTGVFGIAAMGLMPSSSQMLFYRLTGKGKPASVSE